MKDNTNPSGAWEFNAEVASCFANMLERSIPDYRSMRALVYNAGKHFIKPGTLVVDVVLCALGRCRGLGRFFFCLLIHLCTSLMCLYHR